MRNNVLSKTLALLLVAALQPVTPALVLAQQLQHLSRTMQQAITLYDKGKDQEALDHFIDVLSRGDSEERTLASEYITKINLRMAGAQGTRIETPAPKATALNAAGKTAGPKPLPPATPLSAMSPAAAATAATALKAPLPPPPAAAAPATVAGSAPSMPPPAPPMRSEAAMRKEIATRMATRRKQLMETLRKEAGVQVSEEDEKLDSIAIPSDLLFDRDTNFRIPQAEKVLSALAGLAYLNGDAALLIWPEKFQAGEPSLVDMRRAMALRNFLLSDGISPARVSANLIGSVGNPPRKLYGFSGPIIQFRYGEPLKLTQQSTGLAAQNGPALSLGALPERFSPSDEQGTLLEFSVLEGDNGVAGWRFSILPSANPEKGAPLQELTGEGAAFHQVYWNGRINYFGEQVPYGRYPVLLTAQDLKGGKSTQRLILVLEPPKAPEPAPVAVEAPPARRETVAVTPEDAEEETEAEPAAKPAKKGRAYKSGGGAVKAGVAAASARGKGGKAALKAAAAAGKLAKRGKKGKGGKAAKGKTKGKSMRAAAAETPKAEAPPAAETPAEAPAYSSSGSANQVAFERGTTKLTPNGENDLAKAVDAVRFYPYAKKVITGYASRTEDNAAVLAEKRAQVVKGLLAEKYGVDPTTMRVDSKVVEEDAAKVDIGLEPGQN